MSNHKPEAHGGPVPERKAAPKPDLVASDNRARSLEREMNRPLRVAAVYGILVLLGMIGFFYWVMIKPMPVVPTHELESKQMAGIARFLDEFASHDDSQRDPAPRTAHMHLRGEDFWAFAIDNEMPGSQGIEDRLTSVSSSTDEHRRNRDAGNESPWCSYTAPRSRHIGGLWGRKGNSRCVVVCFNARNWNNYGDRGVLVLWSDEHTGEFLTFEEAHDDWGITRAEWDDPAGKLFGKKAPFQHTYE